MTSIEWTEATWNPVTGCDRVSPGCAHCYALTFAGRLKAMGQRRYQRDGDPKTSGPGFGLTLHPDKLEEPLRWRKPRMVFVNSMSDLFHEAVPDEYIARVFTAMMAAPQHTFQVLTKRPERMRDWFAACGDWEGWVTHDGTPPERAYDGTGIIVGSGARWPLRNVWLGVSIENRRFVHRADLLRQVPAAVRFISAEPLLGPLVPFLGWRSPRDRSHGREPELIWGDGYEGDGLDLADIDWLICGGESGPKHRPMKLEWARDLRDVCRDSGTAFFVKQLGGHKPGTELDDLPADLRIREFPQTQEALSL